MNHLKKTEDRRRKIDEHSEEIPRSGTEDEILIINNNMKTTRVLLLSLFLILSLKLSAKDYNASLFGIKSNGTTLNTTSIQKAIDYISRCDIIRLPFSGRDR